jgi:hypothetical protein
MRQIIQFQVTEDDRGDQILYALTNDGILWEKGADSEWKGIAPPGDGNPFKPELTEERLLARLARGEGFPKGGA